MRKEHISHVAKIEAEVFSTPWSEQAFADACTMDYAFFYVAVVESQLVGYCGSYLAADEGEITNVAVAPGWRRQTIGFQTVGIRKKYYQYPQDDALVMKYESTDIIDKIR